MSNQPLTPAQSVTTARESGTVDLDRRRRRYLWTMGIRVACFVAIIFVDGWLRWAFIAAAVFLPFFAVVLANAVSPRVGGRTQIVVPTTDPTPRLSDSAYAAPAVVIHQSPTSGDRAE